LSRLGRLGPEHHSLHPAPDAQVHSSSLCGHL
jgi:hypothetical protein